MKYKVLIDTDIGDDIDDAFAICLAMKSPEIELLGVTTVYQDTAARARMAKALLAAGGRGEVPVHAGERRPLVSRVQYGRPVDLNHVPLSYRPCFDRAAIDGEDAVGFLIQTLEGQDSPVTIVTLGALTNVAALLLKRPDLKARIARLCIMGGAFDVNLGEYNFCCDPEAADLVLESGIAIDCVGLDVTFRCFPSDEQLKRLEACPKEEIKLLMAMRSQWTHQVFFHDPLAVMCVFDASFVTFCRRKCRVETKGEYTRGCVVNLSDHNWQQDSTASALRVGVEVEGGKFVEKCVQRLLS